MSLQYATLVDIGHKTSEIMRAVLIMLFPESVQVTVGIKGNLSLYYVLFSVISFHCYTGMMIFSHYRQDVTRPDRLVCYDTNNQTSATFLSHQAEAYHMPCL